MKPPSVTRKAPEPRARTRRGVLAAPAGEAGREVGSEPTATGPASEGSNTRADPVVTGLGRLRVAASVLGPVSIATALLYYYGYITTYAQFAYFGVDVELLDYSTADYVLRSPASLFAPVLALLLLVGLGYWVHATLSSSRLLAAHPRAGRITGQVMVVLGLVVFARGVYGVVDGEVSADEWIGTSPVALGLGTLLVLYGLRLRRQSAASGTLPRNDQSTQVVVWAIGWCLVTLSLFWLVNSIANAYGRGAAIDLQEGLVEQPEVILHSHSQLFVESRGVAPGVLCETAIGSKEYPYRYVNLRLLATSDDELFLVPVTWTPERGIVLAVKKDEAQLQYMDWPEKWDCPEYQGGDR